MLTGENKEKQSPAIILLTTEQAAEKTQFCRNTIKKAMRDGELRFGKFGRAIRIKESDLEAWVERKIVGTMRAQGGSPASPTNFQVIEKTTGGRR